MDYEFLLEGNLHTVSLEAKGNHYLVTCGPDSFAAEVLPIAPNTLSVLVDGRSYTLYTAGDSNRCVYVFCGGHQFELTAPSEDGDSFRGGEGRGAGDDLVIKAPMPGKVIKINVKQDDEVRKNQTLAIVEAMKMENEIKSAIDGVVIKVSAAPGDLVDTDTPIIELAEKE